MAYTLTYTDIDDLTTSLTGYTGTPDGDIVIPAEEGGKRVVSIGEDALSLTAITGVEIGENVVSIGQSAFTNCFSLVALTGCASVETLGRYSFINCAFTTVPFMPKLISVGEEAFSSNEQLEEITFSESLMTIADYAFDGCTSLNKITFLGNAPSVGVDPFIGISSFICAYKHATGFTNPFYGLTVVFETQRASLYPSGYDTLALSMWGVVLGVKKPSYGASIPFSDRMYSRVLLSRIMLMNMSGSLADINAYIKFLFPDKVVRVTDNQDMTIRYWFPATLTDEEEALVDVDGVLPRPAGVEAIVEIDGANKDMFGFDGQRAGSFDNSVFVEETEYIPT
jgi:hypothetical protein